MNTPKQSQNEREGARLGDILQSWRVTEPLPPRFQERVWKRIEAADASPVRRTNWFAALFLRPAFATVVAAMLLATGSIVGFVQANHDSARWDRELGQRYVASVDPYIGQR